MSAIIPVIVPLVLLLREDPPKPRFPLAPGRRAGIRFEDITLKIETVYINKTLELEQGVNADHNQQKMLWDKKTPRKSAG